MWKIKVNKLKKLYIFIVVYIYIQNLLPTQAKLAYKGQSAGFSSFFFLNILISKIKMPALRCKHKGVWAPSKNLGIKYSHIDSVAQKEI